MSLTLSQGFLQKREELNKRNKMLRSKVRVPHGAYIFTQIILMDIYHKYKLSNWTFVPQEV